MTELQFADPEQLVHDVQKPNEPTLDALWIDRFLDIQSDSHSLRFWCDANNISNYEDMNQSLMSVIDLIDEILNEQLNVILHDDCFQQLESSWRGVQYLVNQKESFGSEQESKIKILSCSWEELRRDSQRAIEFDQSSLFKLIYQNEFSTPGGEPFGLIVGDYCISHQAGTNKLDRDMTLIRKIAQTAAAAFCPFLVSATPSLFGVDTFAELATILDVQAQFDQLEYENWRAVRASEDAKFVAVTVPYVLMRQPYKYDGSRLEAFAFKEKVSDSESDFLWGSASFCFAATVLRAYSESGWFAHIRGLKAGSYGQGVIVPPVNSQTQFPGKAKRYRSPVNYQVSESRELALSDCGFIPLSPVSDSPLIAFTSNSSLHKPKLFEEKGITVNSRLSSMLQYTLCVARIAHYIKVMGRDKVGSYQNAVSIESDFQRWLHQYTTASDEASDELRAKYPLNEARIQVKEKQGSPGHYYSILHLRPHFQLDQMVSSVRLITELSPDKAF
ncbi:type VI secretion system contractile sheath large subunit [Vibrio penaeicida]|uniref:type VI secretion system contractile sheath large subunit n=1 Tax=Vibrio penaeicida TaxID=104609 RepID=UPI000CEA3969|nr:type VI secretion system contractile sheath large subunit [Vibrio penaeicida]